MAAAPYYGWYVVAACATIACFSWGFSFYGPGLIWLIGDARGSYQPALWVLVVLEALAIAGVPWGRSLRGVRAPVPAG